MAPGTSAGSATLFLFILLMLAPASAVPAAPVLQSLQANDGSLFPARLWGDEWTHGWETADGYAIVFDETRKDWNYAVPGPDGSLVSSGQAVGTGTPAGPIPRHLRPAEKAMERSGSGVSGRRTEWQATIPATGTAAIPVLMINFSDRPVTCSTADFDSLLFGSGTGSMKDYYQEVSYGTFSISPGPDGIAGWYTASRGHDYYGSSAVSPAFGWSGTLVREAVAAADPAVDFAPYDSDGDCYVDVVDIIHQGAGEEAGGNTTDIWSHSYDLNSAYWYGISDGGEYTTDDVCPSGGLVRVNAYVIQPETLWGKQQTIGVFAHEYAHSLAVPDLYDVTYASAGVGAWSLMGTGCWNHVSASGDTPAHLDAWSKSKLGWVVPAEVKRNQTAEIRNAEQNSEVYQLLGNPGGVTDWTGYGSGRGEYFLLENRQRTGFDAALPGDGLLIWHVDESVGTNQNSSHKLVDLEEADGNNDLDSKANNGDMFDPWYNSVTGFTAVSLPDSALYDGSPSNAGMTGIGASAPVMAVTLAAPGSGTVHTLNPGDPIQQNITDAGAGDTIILNPGTYFQSGIIIDRNIVIRANTSSGGTAANTIIDATNAGRIFDTSGGYALAIDNLTLRNGEAAYGGAISAGSGTTLVVTSSVFSNCLANGGGGGAVFANRTDGVVIASTTFTGCTATTGGAIFVTDSDLTIASSTFFSCHAAQGGAVFSQNSARMVLSVSGSTFTGCSATDGGAIYSANTILTVNSSTFSHCGAANGGSGGAIFSDAGATSVSASEFSRCSAAFNGGAIFAQVNSTVLVSSSAFRNCSASLAGGAVSADSGTLSLESTSFSGCLATNGGAVYASSGCETTIGTASTFSACQAFGAGGAIFSGTGSLRIGSTSFSGCSSPAGGAIWSGSGTTEIASSVFTSCTATETDGGAIKGDGPLTLTISDTTFSRCSAPGGSGGAVQAVNDRAVDISNATFSGCSARWGGAAMFIGSYNGSHTVSNSTFSRCSASSGGGGIYSGYGSTTITRTLFNNCSASNGGALSYQSDNLAIDSSKFLSCSSPIGGGLFGYNSSIVVTASTFSGCPASNGAVLYTLGGNTSVRFSRIFNCSTGSAVTNAGGAPVNATDNWWGTNTDPAGLVTGSVTVSPWLVLNISATPASLSPAQSSVVRILLTRNSAGSDTAGGGIFVPDGIRGSFSVPGGGGLVSPAVNGTVNGVAKTRFTPARAGTVAVSATVDNQTVLVPVIVSSQIPAVTGIAPASGIRGRLTEIVNLSGSGFVPGATVSLNRTGWPVISATGVTVVSAKRITCTFAIPAGAPLGYRNIVVKNPGGNPGMKGNAFLVKAPAAPTVNALDPATGPRGSLLTITNLSGTGFVAVPTPKVQLVRNGTVIAAGNVTVVNGRRISCTFAIPAGATTGAWHARVTNGDQQAGVKNGAFTVTG